MRVIVLDYETYYTVAKQGYTLRKMTTEEYIMSDLFEVNGCAVVEDDTAEFLTASEFRRWIETVDWSVACVLSHNARFDMAILAWRYGKYPRFYVDTLGIANQFIRPYTGKSNLDTCAAYLGLPLKTGALGNVINMRAHEIAERPGLWEAYASYAIQDAQNCLAIWKTYWPLMSAEEKIKLDWTTRNYVTAQLELDASVLVENLAEVTATRDQLLKETGLTDPKILTSPAKFADVLKSMGVDVEYKQGAEDDIPAISKNDPFMVELLANPDPAIATMAKARLAFSSNLEITRTKRMQRMCAVTGGLMLTPYNYCAAHTHRPGGADGVNLTNLAGGSKLRRSIKTPPKMVMVTVDASQIEARIIATMAGCEPLVSAFREGRDPYSEFMTMVLGWEVIKGVHKEERQTGKVCILSLQYGVGWATLLKRLIKGGTPCSEDDARMYVTSYRDGYPEILGHYKYYPEGNGYEAVELLKRAVTENEIIPWKWGIEFSPQGIRRPNGSMLFYDHLTIHGHELMYWSHRYKSWQKLYPGSINENLGQSIANDCVGRSHVKFVDKVKLHNYDALSLLVPEEEGQYWHDKLIASMSTPPPWAPELPLAAEGKITRTFGG